MKSNSHHLQIVLLLLAEHIITPGATKSGFILPSRVVPFEDVGNTSPEGKLPNEPVVDVPMVRTFLAVPGGVIL